MGNNLSRIEVKERPMALIRRKLGMMTRKDRINRLINLTLVNDEVQLREFAAKVKLTKKELGIYYKKIGAILGEFCTDMPEVEFKDIPTPPVPEVLYVQSSSSGEDNSSPYSNEVNSSSSSYGSTPSSQDYSGLSTDVDTGRSVCDDIDTEEVPVIKNNLGAFRWMHYKDDLENLIFGTLKRMRDAKKGPDPVCQLTNSAPPDAYLDNEDTPVVHLYNENTPRSDTYMDNEDNPRSTTPTRQPGTDTIASTPAKFIPRSATPTRQPGTGTIASTPAKFIPRSATPTRQPGDQIPTSGTCVSSSTLDKSIARFTTPTRQHGAQTSTSGTSANSSTPAKSIPKFATPKRPLGVDSVVSSATCQHVELSVPVYASPSYQPVDYNGLPRMQPSESQDEMSITTKVHNPQEVHDHVSPRRFKSKYKVLGKIGTGLLTGGRAKRKTKASSQEVGDTGKITQDIVVKETSVAIGDAKQDCQNNKGLTDGKSGKKKKGIVGRWIDKIKGQTSATSRPKLLVVKPATPDCAVQNITKSKSTVPPISEEKQRPNRRIVWPSDVKGPTHYNKSLENKGNEVIIEAPKVTTDDKVKVRGWRESRGGC